MKRLSRYAIFGVALATLLVASPACQKPAPPPESVTSTFERGPLKLTITATPKNSWIGDPVHVTLEVMAPSDCLVEFPDAKAFGDGVDVLKQETAAPTPVEKGTLWRQVADVEPLTTGVVEIPPLVVKYGTPPPGAASQTGAASQPVLDNELLGESLKLEVRSALTSQDSLMSPRDITAALLAPSRPLRPWQWALLALAAVAVLAGLWAWIRWLRLRALRPPPPIAPEVRALRELAGLDPAAWLGRGETREFYYRISEVVRTYIERKFGIAAPEMTTEEFLVALSRNRSALPYDARKLGLFLEACDLVKYAAFEPRVEDATHALEAARAFINATAAAAEASARAAAEATAQQGAAA